jgi:hypothetical protein
LAEDLDFQEDEKEGHTQVELKDLMLLICLHHYQMIEEQKEGLLVLIVDEKEDHMLVEVSVDHFLLIVEVTEEVDFLDLVLIEENVDHSLIEVIKDLFLQDEKEDHTLVEVIEDHQDLLRNHYLLISYQNLNQKEVAIEEENNRSILIKDLSYLV